MTITVLQSFAADWARLHAGGAADAALTHWAGQDPRLAGFGSVTELVGELDRADAEGDYATSDVLRGVLMGRAPTSGDTLSTYENTQFWPPPPAESQ